MAAHQQLRITLAEELGLDPSSELRRLEAAVLAEDPALGAPVPPQTDGAVTGPAGPSRHPGAAAGPRWVSPKP